MPPCYDKIPNPNPNRHPIPNLKITQSSPNPIPNPTPPPLMSPGYTKTPNPNPKFGLAVPAISYTKQSRCLMPENTFKIHPDPIADPRPAMKLVSSAGVGDCDKTLSIRKGVLNSGKVTVTARVTACR